MKPLWALGISFLCQLIGLLLCMGAGPLLPAGSGVYALLQGAVAAGIARFFRLSWPWIALNFVLPAGTYVATVVSLPQWVLAALAGVLLLIFLPTVWTHVPFYPTSREVYDTVLEQLPESGKFRFADLGCGFGTMLFYLAKKRPDAVFEGFEIGPLPYLLARLRALAAPNVRIYCKDFWKLNFADYNFIYAFLAPPPMPRVWEKAKADCPAGTILLINSFPLPAKPFKVYEFESSRNAALYLYRV